MAKKYHIIHFRSGTQIGIESEVSQRLLALQTEFNIGEIDYFQPQFCMGLGEETVVLLGGEPAEGELQCICIAVALLSRAEIKVIGDGLSESGLRELENPKMKRIPVVTLAKLRQELTA